MAGEDPEIISQGEIDSAGLPQDTKHDAMETRYQAALETERRYLDQPLKSHLAWKQMLLTIYQSHQTPQRSFANN